jgi:hypothetical protein
VLISYEHSEPSKEPTAAVNAARRILTERFGAPSRDGTSNDWLWLFPTTTIRLSVLFIEDISSSAFICFTATAEAPKLDRPSAF